MHEPSAAEDEWLADALERFAQDRADTALRDEIVERTAWLAVRGARRFSDRGEPFDDLLQVARIGLIKAVNRFDPVHGVHFRSYATPTIVGELRRHFRDHTWSLHVPRRAKDVRPAVNTAVEELTRELERSPTIAEIAQRVHQSVDVVLEALEANGAYRARPLDPGTGIRTDLLQAPSDGGISRAIDRQLVFDLLDQLGPRDRTILYLRFFEELSQAQIAERVGTSQVHVGRLLNAALVRLRQSIGEADAGLDVLPTDTREDDESG